MSKRVTFPNLNSTEPYRLPFENKDFILYKSVFEKHNAATEVKRSRQYRAAAIVAMERELLKVVLRINAANAAEVYLRVTPDELLIWCNEHEDNGRLRGFKALVFIYWFSNKTKLEFADYYWPDLVDDTGQSTYLEIGTRFENISFQPKAKYGMFFRPAVRCTEHLEEVISETIPPDVNNQAVSNYHIGYCIVYTSIRGGHSPHYPFLIPYWGILNKDNTSIRNLGGYIFGRPQEPELNFTVEQLALNSICADMNKIAAFYSPDGTWYTPPELEQKKEHMFRLWRQAMPLLLQQTHTYRCWSYGMKHSTHLRKKDMFPCLFSHETVNLSFTLTDKGDYYQLTMAGAIADTKIDLSKDHIPFFVSDAQLRIQLLPHLRDQELLLLFQKSGGKLSILKVHMTAFGHEFLNHISHAYPVNLSGSKKIMQLQPGIIKKIVYLQRRNGKVFLEPCVRYDNGTECNVLQNGIFFYEIAAQQLTQFKRDKRGELALKQIVLSIHSDFSCQQSEHYTLQEVFVTESWLGKVEIKLEQAGVELVQLSNEKI